MFFDVDFTLIYPGPAFQGEGYQRFCAGHGVAVDAGSFDDAVKASSFIIDDVEEPVYNHELFVRYTASIIEHMGGRGPGRGATRRGRSTGSGRPTTTSRCTTMSSRCCARLVERGYIVGAISNSHRSLDAFCEHFSLRG